MKLCLIISSLNSGGAERVATTLANHWAEKDWQVTLITFADTEQDFYTVVPAVKRIGLNMLAQSSGMLSGLS